MTQGHCEHSKRLKDWISDSGESRFSRLKGMEVFRDAVWKRGGLVPRFVLQQKLEQFYPRLDVYETNGEYFIMAEIPGIELKDIDLFVGPNTVKLRGERKKSVPEEGRRVFLEQLDGTFRRSLTLEDEVDPKQTKARLAQGILRITLPKRSATAEDGHRVKIEIE
jgi:HSP20 family protein